MDKKPATAEGAGFLLCADGPGFCLLQEPFLFSWKYRHNRERLHDCLTERGILVRAAPTTDEQRIQQLDGIRGFALFGIFLVNMPTFLQPALFLPDSGLPADHSPMDEWIRLLLNMFVQTKFYTIFSFLFGAGFYLFMSRAERKGVPMQRLYLRRIAVLFVFGMLHLLFGWYGDILHSYALAGLILLLFYRRKDASVRRWAWTLLIGMQTLYALTLIVPSDTAQDSSVGQPALVDQAIEAYNHGSWSQWMQFRLAHELPQLADQEWLVIWSVLPLFLFGFSLARRGLFGNVPRFVPAIWRVWWCVLVASVLLVSMIPLLQYGVLSMPASRAVAAQVFVEGSGLTLSAFYICSLLLLYEKERGQQLLKVLEPVGRMALTNYLAQTVVSVLLARVFHLYGTAGMGLGLLLCLFVFSLQIVGSRWWLTQYRYGPAEWVWRSLTYGARMPMRRTPPG